MIDATTSLAAQRDDREGTTTSLPVGPTPRELLSGYRPGVSAGRND
jgi:hypothetical protein